MSLNVFNQKPEINFSTINGHKENSNHDILLLNNIDLKQIVTDLINCEYAEEVFYVCNLDVLLERYQLWLSKMPGVIPHYAVKCNDHDIVLKLLASIGVSFDCASKREIQKIKKLNVPSDKILFANPTKLISDIQLARSHDVDLLVFDSEDELLKIKKHYPNARLLMRIRSDDITAFRILSQKFGCDPQTEGKQLIELAKQEGMNLVGVSFHVGSGCKEVRAFHRAIKIARELFNVAKKNGLNCTVLDIGGGFPGHEANDGLFDEISKVINNALKCHFSDVDGLRVIAEPGRFFVTKAFTLTSCIHSKKVRKTVEGDGEFMYIICDGIYGSFDRTLYSKEISPANVIKKIRKTNLYKTSFWGPTCDSLDQIPSDILLPELEIGDWVCFENMGAYSISLSSYFNGFGGVPIKFYISETTLKMIQEQQKTD